MKSAKNSYQIFLVTGNVGVGKTHYLKSIIKLLPNKISNVFFINCDEIAKELYLKNSKVKNFFENNLKLSLWKNNKLDYYLLLKFILENKNNIQLIENFIWPLVIEKVNQEILLLKKNFIFFSLYIEVNMRFCLSEMLSLISFDKIILCVNKKQNLSEKFSVLNDHEKTELLKILSTDADFFKKTLSERKINFKVKEIEFI
ncbi:dephospho-CoA kinase [symbiont of Argiope bruennichi]|uniref:hypothetical protein n=1 Tax=symbiont of Argiope bruennichi TaxID=2810479 RepID=UPI003DA510DA